MPAARDQAQEGRLERLGLQEVGRDVTVEVVDLDHRQPARRRQRLRRRDPDQERADQARASGDGDCVEVVERDARLLKRGVDDRVHELQVMPRGDLGHDAAERRMGRGLRGDDVREDPAPIHHGRAGVVAARLDREDHVRPALELHHERVLAVVLVVAPAVPNGVEPEAPVHLDGRLVGTADLEHHLVRALDLGQGGA